MLKLLMCCTQVGCGQNHTIAVTSEGFAYTWGNGGYGRCVAVRCVCICVCGQSFACKRLLPHHLLMASPSHHTHSPHAQVGTQSAEGRARAKEGVGVRFHFTSAHMTHTLSTCLPCMPTHCFSHLQRRTLSHHLHTALLCTHHS